MKKRKLRAGFFVCAFLLFLLLMDYPYLSRLYNGIISGEVVASFSVSEESADCERRLRWAVSYNRYLAGEDGHPGLVSSWQRPAADSGNTRELTGDRDASGEDSTKKKAEWLSAARVLCPDETDLAGWIRIPSLDLVLPLFIGTQEEALNQGAGILEGCSLPVGGESTHACISAHRGLPDRTLFTNLDMLHNRDRIEVHTLGKTICYEIYGNETVRPADTRSLAILPGQDLLTLITCTPYGINTHRLYVHARRCSPEEEEQEEKDGLFKLLKRLLDPVFWKLWWWVPATIVLLLLLTVLVRRSFQS